MKDDLLSSIWATPHRRPELTVREWETLLGQARQGTLQGRLAQHLVLNGWSGDIPEGVIYHLQGALRLVERQRREVTWEVTCIRRALAKVDTPIVLLKGAAYVAADLRPALGRLFSDVDIMVARPQLEAVESALFAAGWISAERDAYNNRYYREWMHELPPMRHVQRGTTLDVHHTITPPTSRFHVDGAQLLDRIQAIPNHAGLHTLGRADMVLHAAAHLFLEGELSHGLRDLLDLDDLIAEFSQEADFWDDLLNRAEELGLQTPLSHALIHLKRLFSTVAPHGLAHRIVALNRSSIGQAIVSSLLGIALRPEHPSCDRSLTAIARWLLYVRSHHLRMPAHLLLPHLVRKAFMRLQADEPHGA